jgi:hypothetical protein
VGGVGPIPVQTWVGWARSRPVVGGLRLCRRPAEDGVRGFMWCSATCSGQHATCNRPRATDNMQRTTCHVQRTTCSGQQTTCSRQRATDNTHRPVRDGPVLQGAAALPERGPHLPRHLRCGADPLGYPRGSHA